MSASRACTSGIRKASTASSSAGVTGQSRARSSTTCHEWPSSDDGLVDARASHEGYVRMRTLKVLAARWSLRAPLSLLRSAWASRLSGLARMGGSGRWRCVSMTRGLTASTPPRNTPHRSPSECPLSGLSFTGKAETPFLIDRRPPVPPRTLCRLLLALRRQIDSLPEIDMSQRSLL